MTRQNDDTQDYNNARQDLLDAGIQAATRAEWIERTGQDPDDPTTWNRSVVDIIREQQRAAANKQ